MTQQPFVPVEELAKHFTVTVSCIRGWIRQGKIPKHTYIKVGNTYRFNVPAVVDALLQLPKPQEKTEVTAVEVGGASVPVQLELNFNPDEDL